MMLTVIEGFIVGLFFIQAPQEWWRLIPKHFSTTPCLIEEWRYRNQFLFWLSSADVTLYRHLIQCWSTW